MGCSLHCGNLMSILGVLNTLEGTMSASGRGISWIHWGMFSKLGDIMMHVGDTMSTLRDVQYIRGYHEYIVGYHEYIGVFNRNWKDLSSCSPKCIMISIWCAEHHPVYSCYPPPPPPPSNVLMIFLRCTHGIFHIHNDIPWCTEHAPMYSWYLPMYWTSLDVLNIPQFYWKQIIQGEHFMDE